MSDRDVCGNSTSVRPLLTDLPRPPGPSDLGEMLWALPTHGTAEEISGIVLNHCADWFRAPLGAFWVAESDGVRVLASNGVSEKRIQQWHSHLKLETNSRAPLSLHGAQIAAEYGFAKRRLGALVIITTGEHTGLQGRWMLARLTQQPFSDFEIQLLQLLGDRVAQAIERLFRIHSLESRLNELHKMAAIQNLLVLPLSSAELMQQLTDRLSEELKFASVAVELQNPPGQTVALYHRRPNIKKDLITAWESQRSTAPGCAPPFQDVLGPGITHEVPLHTRGTRLGTLFLFKADALEQGETAWQELARNLAIPIALALENACFHDSKPTEFVRDPARDPPPSR